jgi:hypothetical protein
MTGLTAQERLALTLDELDDVERALGPGLSRLSGDDREDLAQRLRKHLDRARDRDHAGGFRFSSAERLPNKVQAIERALAVVTERDPDGATDQALNAQRAFEMKMAAPKAQHPDPGAHGATGPIAQPFDGAATAAIDAEAQRTVIERTREVR